MFKRFFTYPVFLVLFLSIIASILLSSLVRYHYHGGEKVKSLQKFAVIISGIPFNVKYMVQHKTLRLNDLIPLSKHENKKNRTPTLQLKQQITTPNNRKAKPNQPKGKIKPNMNPISSTTKPKTKYKTNTNNKQNEIQL